MKVFFILLLSSLTLTIITPTYAMRCGTQLVNPDTDSLYIISKKCGKPDSVNTYEQEIVIGSRKVNGRRRLTKKLINLTIWTYDFSPNGFIYTLTFQNNKLINIDENRAK